MNNTELAKYLLNSGATYQAGKFSLKFSNNGRFSVFAKIQIDEFSTKAGLELPKFVARLYGKGETFDYDVSFELVNVLKRVLHSSLYFVEIGSVH